MHNRSSNCRKCKFLISQNESNFCSCTLKTKTLSTCLDIPIDPKDYYKATFDPDPRKNVSHICNIPQNDQSQLRLLLVVNKAQIYPVNTRCGTHHTPTHITQSIKLRHHSNNRFSKKKKKLIVLSCSRIIKFKTTKCLISIGKLI